MFRAFSTLIYFFRLFIGYLIAMTFNEDLQSVPLLSRPGVVGECLVTLVISSRGMMFDVVGRVPRSFFSVVPVFNGAVLVSVPELTASPARKFFTLRALHVVTGFTFEHDIAAVAFLALTPEGEIVHVELDKFFLLLVTACVRGEI